MGQGLRKLALSVHVATSVGWLGSAASFLALAIAGLYSSGEATVRAMYLAMDLCARFVIVPLALAALASGVVQSLGTRWGLLRHYWVVIKLVVTVVAVAVLLLQLEPIGLLAAEAREGTLSVGSLRDARTSLVVHAAGGIITLLVPTALSVYKPRGLTRYGDRKLRSGVAIPLGGTYSTGTP